MSTTPQTVPEHSLVLEKHEDGVATLTLNRPDKLNALSTDLAVAFNETLGRIGTDKNIHAVVLTGAGPGVLRWR
jgi:enoyl-CoA hydratase/carnithine racemase